MKKLSVLLFSLLFITATSYAGDWNTEIEKEKTTAVECNCENCKKKGKDCSDECKKACEAKAAEAGTSDSKGKKACCKSKKGNTASAKKECAAKAEGKSCCKAGGAKTGESKPASEAKPEAVPQ